MDGHKASVATDLAGRRATDRTPPAGIYPVRERLLVTGGGYGRRRGVRQTGRGSTCVTRSRLLCGRCSVATSARSSRSSSATSSAVGGGPAGPGSSSASSCSACASRSVAIARNAADVSGAGPPNGSRSGGGLTSRVGWSGLRACARWRRPCVLGSRRPQTSGGSVRSGAPPRRRSRSQRKAAPWQGSGTASYLTPGWAGRWV